MGGFGCNAPSLEKRVHRWKKKVAGLAFRRYGELPVNVFAAEGGRLSDHVGLRIPDVSGRCCLLIAPKTNLVSVDKVRSPTLHAYRMRTAGSARGWAVDAVLGATAPAVSIKGRALAFKLGAEESDLLMIRPSRLKLVLRSAKLCAVVFHCIVL